MPSIKSLLIQGAIAVLAVFVYNSFISPKLGTPQA